MNQTVTIRLATTDDCNLIVAIGRHTFYETWIHMNTEEDMQRYMDESFEPGKIKKDLADGNNTFLIAEVEGAAIGYVKIRRDRTYDEFKGTRPIEIERIYVKKEFQGIKAGKAMMGKSIEIARDEKYDWLWLGVNIDNHKAIAFYKQYGFSIFGSKMFKLGDAVDEDYLMKMKL